MQGLSTNARAWVFVASLAAVMSAPSTEAAAAKMTGNSKLTHYPSVHDMPVPIAGEVHGLAALHRQ